MKKFLLIQLVVVLLGGLIFSGCAAPAPSPSPASTPSPASSPAKVIELKVASGLSDLTVYFNAMRQGTSWVEQEAKGAVKFTYYPSGALLSSTQAYSGVAEGTADISDLVVSYLPGRFPLTEVLDLGPGLLSAEQHSPTYQAIFDKFLVKEWAEVKVLWMFAAGPVDIHSRQPVRTSNDMKGLRLRTFGYAANVVKKLGGVPVNLPAAEVYEALLKGTVDGSTMTPMAQKTQKLVEVTKYITALGITSTPYVMLMNRKKYDSLPDNLKKLFDQLGERMPRETGKLVDAADKEGYDLCKARGGEVINLTPQERANFLKDVADLNSEWVAEKKAKGLDVSALVEVRNNLLKPYFPEAFK